MKASVEGVMVQHVWGWRFGMLVAGGLQAASMAWPGYGQTLWWLQLLSLGGLCAALLQSRNAKAAAAHAWWFAVAWLGGTFWWLFISMHTYGGLPAPLAVLAVLALASFLAAYYALAAWAWQRWRMPGWRGVLSFVALWTLAELARGTLWTGFPWGAGGYAHVDGPLSVWASWVGVYGVGAMAALLAMALAAAPQLRLRKRGVLVAAGGIAVVWGALAWQQQAARMADGGPRAPIDVALLQGNIAQDEKFVAGAGIAQALEWYGEQFRTQEAALVVAPETAIPLLPRQLAPGYLDAMAERYRLEGGQQAALVGMPMLHGTNSYSNAVIGWMPGAAEDYRYNKHHLVPFGEFIPPFFRWFVQMMNIPLGDFHRGALDQPALDWRGERWGVNICYEDLFGEELAARFRDPAQAPSVLVNVSNIAWFGDSTAVDQHLHISRMRALELGRPMLRATNNGATAVIDHHGRVTAFLAPHTRGVLQAQVQGQDAITPYVRWVATLGLWPLVAWCLMALLWAIKLRKNPEKTSC